MGSRQARLRLAFAATLTLAAVVAPTASADFYAATKHGDHAPDGCTKSDCTLREAILAANANPGRDRILLASNRPYHLSRGGPPDDGALRGDLDITNDPLRIYHGNRGWATIDARGVDRVFEIFAGAPTHFENLRITGGKHPSSFDGNGGGIRTDASLWLLHCILTGNHAAGVEGSGGGLQAANGKLTILNTTVSDNVADDCVRRARHRKSRRHDQAQHYLRQPGLVRGSGVFLRRRELDDRLEHGLWEPVDERDGKHLLLGERRQSPRQPLDLQQKRCRYGRRRLQCSERRRQVRQFDDR